MKINNRVRVLSKARNGHLRRAGIATALIAAGLVTFGTCGAANASTAQFATLYSKDHTDLLTANASQSSWTGTVSVSGTITVHGGGCATVLEQGHNAVMGYGAWQKVVSTCSGASFTFSVSDYYSDSVALKITNSSGSTSTHVWH